MPADNIIYDCSVSGTYLTVKNNNQTKYKGLFAEKLIVISFTETRDVEGEEKQITIEYYYLFQEA